MNDPAGWLLLVVGTVGLLLVVVGAAGMAPSAADLKAAGHSIVDFELARTGARARAILHAWGPKGRQAAIDNLLADVPFLLGYGLVLAVLAWAPANELAAATSPDAGTLSRALAIAAVVAALLDVIEDLCLCKVLARWDEHRSSASGSSSNDLWISRWAAIAAIAASIKFAIVLAVIVWVGLFVWPVLLVSSM